jgi:hypothetical protein
MASKHAVVNLIGVMPDGVIPNQKESADVGLDIVYIYYREDGDLYLYDTTSKKEFNIFKLPINE